MNVIISNKSKLGLGQVKVSTNNTVGKVNFSKISKLVGTLGLEQLNDVDTSVQKNGSVLVYNAANNNYIIETLPGIDGGVF